MLVRVPISSSLMRVRQTSFEDRLLLSQSIGVGVANLGVQLSFGSGIWQLSVTPPLTSVGVGAAGYRW